MTLRHLLILTALAGALWSPAASATRVSDSPKADIHRSVKRLKVAESEACGIARIRCGMQERECMLKTSMWEMQRCYEQKRICMRQNGCNK